MAAGRADILHPRCRGAQSRCGGADSAQLMRRRAVAGAGCGGRRAGPAPGSTSAPPAADQNSFEPPPS